MIGSVVASQNNIRNIIRPYLFELSKLSGESCCLAIEEQMEVVYIDSVDGPDSMLTITQRIGKRAPMHSTGVGKALLTNYSREQLEKLVAEKGLVPLTAHTITDPESLRKELETLRKNRYCLDDEECELGARCIAAPLRDYSGKVIAALSISGPIVRMSPQKIETLSGTLLGVVDRIEKHLGFRALGER